MTPTKRSLSRRADDLPGETDESREAGLITVLSTAANGGEIEPLDDPEYATRVARTAEEHGWPEEWFR